MLKDLNYNDFWHIEDGDRKIPVIQSGTWRGHYDDKADTKRWKIVCNGNRPKHFKNFWDAQAECKRRNFRAFGIAYYALLSDSTDVWDSTGNHTVGNTKDLIFNYSWGELQAMTTIEVSPHNDHLIDRYFNRDGYINASNEMFCHANHTELKIDGGHFSVRTDKLSIEDYGCQVYSANAPHSTNRVYVWDSSAEIIAVYIADNTEHYDTVGEMDYVIETRASLLKGDREFWYT